MLHLGRNDTPSLDHHRLTDKTLGETRYTRAKGSAQPTSTERLNGGRTTTSYHARARCSAKIPTSAMVTFSGIASCDNYGTAELAGRKRVATTIASTDPKDKPSQGRDLEPRSMYAVRQRCELRELDFAAPGLRVKGAEQQQPLREPPTRRSRKRAAPTS